MSDAFVLAPSSPTPSAPLHLLPFSLGPSSDPYTSTAAPLSAFFIPRPAPADHNVPEGTPIAAFRGRQLVGQVLEVPRGYRGLVLSTGKRPDRGGLEYRCTTASSSRWPLTPAPSTASTISVDGMGSTASTMGDEEACGMRRSPRKVATAALATLRGKVKGAGQVALSKPRQVTKPSAKKRFRLDSDDEDDYDGASIGVRAEPPSRLMRTPSKRTKTKFETPGKHSPASTARDLPNIVVQAPTPLKEPLPPPRKRLPSSRIEREYVPMTGEEIERIKAKSTEEAYGGVEILDEEESVKVEAIKVEAIKVEAIKVEATNVEAIKDDMEQMGSIAESNVTPPEEYSIHVQPIPAEALMTIMSMEKVGDIPPGLEDTHELQDIEGSIRVLRPTAAFDSFTIWTPDAALPGFKADEVSSAVDSQSSDGFDKESEPQSASQEEGGLKLNVGWWRTGGAGEGGDEVVRAMGEWMGLVEMLNKPVYLNGVNDEDEEDE